MYRGEIAERLERQTEDPEVPCSSPDAAIDQRSPSGLRIVPGISLGVRSAVARRLVSTEIAQAVKRSFSRASTIAPCLVAPQSYNVTNTYN